MIKIMKLLEGKKIADGILEGIKKDIEKAENKPFLAVLLVGEDEASKIYTSLKGKAAEKIGIGFELFYFEESVLEEEIIGKIEELNQDDKISGIIVQLPLPLKFNTQKIVTSVDPSKDVDGFHPENIELFLKGRERFFPVFPQAIMKIVESSGEDLSGKKAIIVANSKLFGEMMVKSLESKKVKAEYIFKKDILSSIGKLREADILVSAIGVKNAIQGEMIKMGAIVVDGGIVKEGRKIFGDVDFKSVKERDGFLTPVPGGVGPVTIACLLKNVYLASKQ